MKRVSLVLMFFLTLTSFVYLNAQWARTYGGSGLDTAYSIQQTSDGGYIVAGYTSSFGAGGSDVWVLKVDPNGNTEWQKTYGGSDLDTAYSIQQTSDGGYIVAGYTNSFGAGGSDFWVLKLFSTGDIEWQKTYGGTQNDVALSIQQTSDEGYIVAGYTHSFIYDRSSTWVLKLSSNGNTEWQKTYGGSPQALDTAYSIQQTSDGEYIVAGYTEPTQYEDFWVLKLFSTGDIEWQRTYGGSNSDWGRSIQQTSDGGYIFIGDKDFFASMDICVLKLSATGHIEWQKTYGGSNVDRGRSLQQTSDGGYIIAGSTNSFGDGSLDVWVLKLSSTGDIEWQKTYGGSGLDTAYSIQQTSDGGYIVAGDTYSFGIGECDFLILKLFPDGSIDPSCWFIRSSNATITGTYVSLNGASTMSRDTNVVPVDIVFTPRDTNANAYLVCDGPKYDFTISVTAGGTTNPLPGTHTYYIGIEFRIEALADIGYRFSYWTGDVPSEHENDNPITITMDTDKSITANFSSTQTGGGNGGGEKKGCFIATAAYGSPWHTHLDVLRDFRDKYFMPNKIGKKLVGLYYKYSPYVADLIAKHKVLRMAVRISFLPLVAFSYSILHFGLVFTTFMFLFIFLLPILPILFCLRRMRRVEASFTWPPVI